MPTHLTEPTLTEDGTVATVVFYESIASGQRLMILCKNDGLDEYCMMKESYLPSDYDEMCSDIDTILSRIYNEQPPLTSKNQ